MADFSKQYCELNDMGFDGDFDVYEEWNKLPADKYIDIICEGFGFSAIAKDPHTDVVLVYLKNWDDDSKSAWVNFDDMFLESKSKV